MGYTVNKGTGHPLSIDGVPYWNVTYAMLLKAVGESRPSLKEIFPEAIVRTDAVEFIACDNAGRELLEGSSSLKAGKLPAGAVRSLQEAVDCLHAWAEDTRVPQEKRAFCRNFRLPDPKHAPEYYRLSGGPFSRKLHVLWGFEKEGTKSFLPLSSVAKNWEDVSDRSSIAERCRGSLWKRIFSVRNVFLAAVLAALGYILFFMPVYCPVHNCVIGRGVLSFADAEKDCPFRCDVKSCNRHLNAEGKCVRHVCRTCGKQLPYTNGHDGQCDACFWELR